jgi:hypothetical protein
MLKKILSAVLHLLHVDRHREANKHIITVSLSERAHQHSVTLCRSKGKNEGVAYSILK